MLHDLPSRTDFWQTYEGIQYNWRHFESWDDRARAVFGGEGARSSNSYTYLLDLQPLHLRADAHSGSRPGVCVCVCVCLCVSLSLCLCLCAVCSELTLSFSWHISRCLSLSSLSPCPHLSFTRPSLSLSLSLPHLRSTQKRFVTQCFFCNACATYFRFLFLHHTAHTKKIGKLAAKLKIYS
jgi:hypothetical protein